VSATGFVWHERYAWHDTGTGAGPLRAGGWIEPGEPMAESAAAKRRIRNLVDASGLLQRLVELAPRPATDEELGRFHTPGHLARVRELSDGEGGPCGPGAFVGRGSYEIAALAAGGTITALEAVLDGRVANAYALVRPCGHHALADQGMGFCLFNNVVVAALHARATAGVGRIAILDWDVHHGNGAQAAFYGDPSVLTISLHQAGSFPIGAGEVSELGEGAGEGTNLNVPLPPGSGIGAYRAAMERVVAPAIRAFAPELILVACGFDAAGQDPLGRMLLPAREFGELTGTAMALAEECCDGRLVLSHEGGYNPGLTPFCGLFTLERLSGERTEVEDPFLFGAMPGQELQPHQAAAVDAAAAQVARVPA
jgi:acetoin utilization deacetylase AcuC-like enzyme